MTNPDDTHASIAAWWTVFVVILIAVAAVTVALILEPL